MATFDIEATPWWVNRRGREARVGALYISMYDNRVYAMADEQWYNARPDWTYWAWMFRDGTDTSPNLIFRKRETESAP